MNSTILPEQGLVLTRAAGHLGARELHVHHAALVEDPRFHPDLDQFCDLRSVTSVQLTGEALRRLAEINPFGPGSRRAIVVEPGDRLVFGLSRIYQGHATDDGDRLVVQFDHVEAALAWLGAGPAVLTRLPAA